MWETDPRTERSSSDALVDVPGCPHVGVRDLLAQIAVDLQAGQLVWGVAGHELWGENHNGELVQREEEREERAAGQLCVSKCVRVCVYVRVCVSKCVRVCVSKCV